ncbi:MAG: hexokinase [Prevotellaceae bacterium]|jgi:hexokinase|nr:hexokinase [Prevotellaceae bacterium]
MILNDNIFELTPEQLKEIALALKAETEKGLAQNDMQVQCLPTYINPNKNISQGKALVLDLGGTNYRAAIVEFIDGKPHIHPENGFKKDLSKMKDAGFTRENLFKEIADLISELNLDGVKSIGYCFSYPAEPALSGDAKLLRWTKGVDIKEMVNENVGEPLMKYLNDNLEKAQFTNINVINDTIASLFSGLTDRDAQAHIGLIVGTGTNMATFIHSDKIAKLNPEYTQKGLVPINLESGNFVPPYLTAIDETVDSLSDSAGRQRFEKAVSGMYLGEILKAVFPNDRFEAKFDAQKLTTIMNYPDIHKEQYVRVARQIYQRSAKLVAASLAGLTLALISHDGSIKKVCLTAEGSLFWSHDDCDTDYNKIVLDELHKLLGEFGYGEVRVNIPQQENANLIGSAVAALS